MTDRLKDKAVGLLAAAKDMVTAAATDNPTARQSAVINLETAIAKYEEATK